MGLHQFECHWGCVGYSQSVQGEQYLLVTDDDYALYLRAGSKDAGASPEHTWRPNTMTWL